MADPTRSDVLNQIHQMERKGYTTPHPSATLLKLAMIDAGLHVRLLPCGMDVPHRDAAFRSIGSREPCALLAGHDGSCEGVKRA